MAAKITKDLLIDWSDLSLNGPVSMGLRPCGFPYLKCPH